MVRVINNLLSSTINAIRRFCYYDGSLKKWWSRDNCRSSAGDPISKEVLEQLFARFYRAKHPVLKKRGTGRSGGAENISHHMAFMMYAESENGQTKAMFACQKENQVHKQFKEKLK